MFSGLVEEIAIISNVIDHPGKRELVIKTHFKSIVVGDSISVNGTCLTVTKIVDGCLYFDCINETLKLTNLSIVKAGDKINLERSLTMSKPVGGHLVQGHVDGMAEIVSITEDGDSLRMMFKVDDEFAPLLVKKGYIALDGVSLTITKVEGNNFEIGFIPHTINNTIVQHYHPSRMVNLEIDAQVKTMANLMKNLSKPA